MKFQMASRSRFGGGGGGGKSHGLHVVTLQNMTLTKFLTSPISITIQYDTQYRLLSDASVTISSVRLHMQKLQTKLRTALFCVDKRSSQLLRGASLKSSLKTSFVKLSQLVQIKKRTWTHTHSDICAHTGTHTHVRTHTHTHTHTHICTQSRHYGLLSLLSDVFTKKKDERGNHDHCPT
jgi:hypothetical protein